MEKFGYTPERRSAWWQWCHKNRVPLIRTGQKKIQFSEQAVMDWLARRSSTRKIGGSAL